MCADGVAVRSGGDGHSALLQQRGAGARHAAAAQLAPARQGTPHSPGGLLILFLFFVFFFSFSFLFSSLFFSQVVDVEACHKGLASVVLKKDDLRQASSGDIPRMGDEMNSATKTAVQNLKMLESICREPNVDRGAFLKIAKETAISVHALMRLAQDKGLNAVHDVLNENVGRVIGLGKELIKERAEQGEETDGVVEGEFVAAMKAMGESIK